MYSTQITFILINNRITKLEPLFIKRNSVFYSANLRHYVDRKNLVARINQALLRIFNGHT